MFNGQSLAMDRPTINFWHRAPDSGIGTGVAVIAHNEILVSFEFYFLAVNNKILIGKGDDSFYEKVLGFFG